VVTFPPLDLALHNAAKLGKRILRTITPAEVADVAHFETAQPVDCPKCQNRIRNQFMAAQIVHDLAKYPV